jgi:hypothetical protein
MSALETGRNIAKQEYRRLGEPGGIKNLSSKYKVEKQDGVWSLRLLSISPYANASFRAYLELPEMNLADTRLSYRAILEGYDHDKLCRSLATDKAASFEVRPPQGKQSEGYEEALKALAANSGLPETDVGRILDKTQGREVYLLTVAGRKIAAVWSPPVKGEDPQSETVRFLGLTDNKEVDIFKEELLTYYFNIPEGPAVVFFTEKLESPKSEEEYVSALAALSYTLEFV